MVENPEYVPGPREHEAVVEGGHEEHDEEAASVNGETDDTHRLSAFCCRNDKKNEGSSGKKRSDAICDTICDFFRNR